MFTRWPSWGHLSLHHHSIEIMKKIITNLAVAFGALCFGSSVAHAQKMEAESATLTGGATIINNAASSGGAYVAQREGNLAFKITTAKEAFYNVYMYVSSPQEKINIIKIDGAGSDFKTVANSQFVKLKVVSSYKLAAGVHTLEIAKSWGWIDIDYVELEAVDPSTRFNINKTLVTPNPTKEAVALYQFLYDNYGKKIISGVMNEQPFDCSDWLKQNTGKEPVVLGLDLMHTNRNYDWFDNMTPIHHAVTWYAKNGIPTILWHWRDPSRVTEQFYTKSAEKPTGTTFDVSKINDPTSTEYKAMLKDIDTTAVLLKKLQAANVPALFRPLHEAAGGWFWWGAKNGASCKKLWQLMYDRIVKVHGVRNLIWVWTYEPKEDGTWYPGDDYVDIVGRDVYKDGDHSSQAIEFNNMNERYTGKKMVTLSETGSFPDVENLVKDGAAWSWFMPWYGDYTKSSQYNSLDLWKKNFASDYVLTLDEMPNLKTYGTVTGWKENEEEGAGIQIAPNPFVGSAMISALGTFEYSIYDLTGKVWETGTGESMTEVGANMARGLYVVRIQTDRGTLVRTISKK